MFITFFDIFLLSVVFYLMMKRILLFLLIILPLSTIIAGTPNNHCSAALPIVYDSDLVGYGYTLVANETVIDVKTESNLAKYQVTPENINPPGLYYELLGMELGTVKNAIITPDQGFQPSDPSYGYLSGLTLYFNNLKIYEINGYHITDIPTGGPPPGSFGYIFIRISIALVSIAAAGLIGYGGYRLYPRILGKKCAVCKTIAIGTCKKCGRVFCERCYSNGCPYCKSRTLIRFK